MFRRVQSYSGNKAFKYVKFKMFGELISLDPTFNRNRQRLKFTWKGVKKENQIFDENKRPGKPQINKKVSKNTYIDDIIHLHSKKNYPRPGPGDHFLDEKLASKFYKEGNGFFVAKRDDKKKTNFGTEQRKFPLKSDPSFPAPGHCQPQVGFICIIEITIYLFEIEFQNMSTDRT